MGPAGMQHALRMFKGGQFEKAFDVCTSLLKKQPDNPRILLLMGAICQRLSNREAAVSYLLAAAKAFGTDTDGVLQAVIALQRIGAASHAVGILQQLDSRHAAVASMKAQNTWLLGNYQTALLLFRKVRQDFPDVAEIFLSCARAELRLGLVEDALQTLNEGLVRFPENEPLLRLKIACSLDTGNPAMALQLAQTLPTREPESRLLSTALRSALAHEPFVPEQVMQDERQAAKISSHQWLRQKGTQATWFGTGTAVLRWAAENAPADGVAVECGVYHGLSINQMAEWCGLEVHGFDSFEGLPEDWKAGEPAGTYSTDGKLPQTHERVRLYPGWFEHTLPSFAASLDSAISLLHIDCDLYSSTRTALEQLGPLIRPGTILVFDDFLSYPQYEEHEFKAANEFFSTFKHPVSLKAAVLLGRSVAFRVE